MYKLIIEDDEGKTTIVPWVASRDEITIGRKEGNTIRLTERNVSRRHAKLVRQNGSVQIEDLQSYNGIKLNGDRISGRAPLSEGDRIQIGDYQLALKLDKAASAPAPAERSDEKTTPFIKDEKTSSIAPTTLQPVLQTQGNPDQPARLVVVSSNFARREFSLDKSEVVIGRTDDNDIVINHRSISRHHAKIVREAGHHHVVDQQSANGVRVNGEEYGKVELRKGDHIDLGHVRLRFIAPGEDFNFDRDAKIVEVAGDKKGKSSVLIIAAVAVLLLAVGGFGIYKLLGKSGGGETPGAGGSGGSGKKDIPRLNMEIDEAMRAKDWDACVTKSDDVLNADSAQESVRDKKTKCESEKNNKVKFDEYTRATKDGDNDRAVTAHEEIGKESVYSKEADATWGVIRRTYVKEHIASAKSESQAGRCEQARKHVEAVLIIDPENTDAQEIARKCGQPTVVPKPARPVVENGGKRQGSSRPANPVAPVSVKPAPPPEEVKRPEPAPSVAPKAEAGGGADAEKLVEEATKEYVSGNYIKASDLAKKAIGGGSGSSKAWRLFGASGCYLNNADDARKSWNHLNNADRQFLRYVCDRNHIKIP